MTKCDIPGCDHPWIFVQHENKIPIKRRCHEHWLRDVIRERPTFTIVRPVTPRADPET